MLQIINLSPLMILESLNQLSCNLSNYLTKSYDLIDEITILQSMTDLNNSTYLNKVVVSLINIERETAAGLHFHSSASHSYHKQGTPSWQLNLYVLIAAVFSEKQYEESLRLISGVCYFLQTNPIFKTSNERQIAIEPVNLSLQELSNLWNILGGKYYPSILCKMRVLTLDALEIKNFTG
ncbi:MAG: DUF4255 domain-containing protein, partial [Bacteroidales bacterium]